MKIKRLGVSAITPTTVTVTLNEAPKEDLTASFFNVSGNTVTKVEKGSYNTIYTLTLGTSLDGKKGALTVNGVSQNYDFTELKVESAKATNLRQLEIKFNKPISVGATPSEADGTYIYNDVLNNLYIDLTKAEDGKMVDKNIAKLVNDSSKAWEAVVSADKKTVTIQSTDGGLLENLSPNLKLNATYTVEAWNVLGADGKYASVTSATEILTDTVRPTVAISNPNSKVQVGSDSIQLGFSEPVKALTAADSKVKVYIDGIEVPVAAITTDTADNDTVAKHKNVVIDVTKLGYDLEKGKHTIAVFGAVDLNNNLLSNNGQQLAFEYVNPADAEQTVPQVKSIDQIADNAFKVVFSTANVDVKGTTVDLITIKNGAFDGSDYTDIKLTDNDFVSAGTDPAKGKVTAKEVTVDGKTHTEWVVILDAVAKEGSETQLAYNNANVMNRTVVVNNFKNSQKDGKEYTKTVTFAKDKTAPVLAKKKDGTDHITALADTFNIQFTDAPFTTDGNGKVEYVAGKKVTVKYTNDKGVTYSEEVTPILNADGVTLEAKITNTDLLKDGAIIAGGKYELVLPDALVKDAEEQITAAGDYMILDGQLPFVGKTVTYNVPGTTDVQKAPQTTTGLIFSSSEVKGNIGVIAQAVGSHATPLVLDDNQIVVVFEGEVDPNTAKKASNYVLGGKALPAATTIEFREQDIYGDSAKEKFALITLPSNTVEFTGGQDFMVSNVANLEGHKMLPVSDVVQLTDNTEPTATKVSVKSSTEIVIDFKEAIQLEAGVDMARIARNFVVKANGQTVTVTNAVIEGRTKLVLTTADNFDNNGDLNVPVSVQIKKDSDGNIFIKDLAGNKAAEKTYTK